MSSKFNVNLWLFPLNRLSFIIVGALLVLNIPFVPVFERNTLQFQYCENLGSFQRTISYLKKAGAN